MYTVIPRPEIIDHRPKSGGPEPEIIDHRNVDDGKKPNRWKNRKRKEQLPYDSLKDHRDNLLVAEFQYKRRIKELEKQTKDITKTYEDTYNENKVLKSILEHGPDAVKMKQLQLDKKEQKGAIENLQEENKELQEKLKELEKVYGAPKDFAMEKNWREALAKARKKREEEDAIPTQGPFAGAKVFKKKRVMIDDDRLADQDSYDLALDSVEKETQILLNKIRQLKREKEQIDYTLLMGKGAVSRNATVATAINDKLNRDLNKFAIRLEKLKLKHKAAKEFNEKTHPETARSVVHYSSDNQSSNTVQPPFTDRPISGAHSSSGLKEKTTQKARHVPESETKQSQLISPVDGIKTNTEQPPRRFSKGDSRSLTNSRVENRSPVYTSSRQSLTRKNDLLNDKKDVKKKPSTDAKGSRSISNTVEATEQRLKEQSEKAPDAKVTARVHSKSESVGRYTHGPEPIGRRLKTVAPEVRFTETQSKRHELDDDKDKFALQSIPKIAFPFGKKPPKRDRRPSEEVSYDEVLTYLQRQNQTNRQGQYHMTDTERHLQEAETPVPIQFNSGGRTVGGKAIRKIMGNTGIRTEDNFYKYL